MMWQSHITHPIRRRMLRVACVSSRRHRLFQIAGVRRDRHRVARLITKAMTATCDSASVVAAGDDNTAAIIAIIVLSLLVFFLCGVVAFLAKHSIHHTQHSAKLDQQRVRKAIDCLRTLNFHAAFISGVEFLKLKKLVAHEEMRDRGLLIYKDQSQRRTRRVFFVIFISHQWLSNSEPDPHGEQFAVMVQAVLELARHHALGSDRPHRKTRMKSTDQSSSAAKNGGSSEESFDRRAELDQQEHHEQLAKDHQAWALLSKINQIKISRMPRRARAFVRASLVHRVLEKTLVWVECVKRAAARQPRPQCPVPPRPAPPPRASGP